MIADRMKDGRDDDSDYRVNEENSAGLHTACKSLVNMQVGKFVLHS